MERELISAPEQFFAQEQVEEEPEEEEEEEDEPEPMGISDEPIPGASGGRGSSFTLSVLV